MTRSFSTGALVLVFTSALAGFANAQVVGSRAELLSALGSGAIVEDFETFTVADGSATTNAIDTFRFTSVVGGQGPGLVVPGFALTLTHGRLQWNGNGYFGLVTKTITGDTPAVVDFSPAVGAFGVDLAEFEGYSSTTTVTVYGPDRTTVLYSGPGLALSGPTPTFFGYQASGGVGRVTLSSSNLWFPVLDNLTFGLPISAAVPVLSPESLAALGVGLALAGAFALRRGCPA